MTTEPKIKDEDLRSFYRKDYVEKFSTSDYQVKRIRSVSEMIPFNQNDIVGDFACGNGIIADLIYGKIKEYYGIDFSSEFIDRFKERINTNAKFKNINAISDDIVSFCNSKANFFDKALTLDFSEHIYDKDFLEIYTAIFNSLKPDGTLYLHTPNRDFIVEILKDKGILKQFEEHIAVRTGKAYERLLPEIGVQNIRIEYIRHHNILKNLHHFSYLPFIGKYFKARLLISCSK